MNKRQKNIKDITTIFKAAAEQENFSIALKAKEMIIKEQDKERKEAAEQCAPKQLTSKDIIPLKDLSLDEKLELIGVLKNGHFPGFEEIRQEIHQMEQELKRRDLLQKALKIRENNKAE